MTVSIDAEVAALWAAVFGEPPAITASASLMLAILVDHLQACPPYSLTHRVMDMAGAIGEPAG